MSSIPRKMEISFFTHRSKTPDWVTIYVQISIHSVKLHIGTTGVKIPITDWDKGKREVAATHPQCMLYNQILQRVRSRLIKIFNDLSDLDQPFGSAHVKHEYLKKFSGKSDFPTLLDRFEDFRDELIQIAKKAEEKGLKRPPGTADGTQFTFRSVYLNLAEFLKAKKLRKIQPLDFDVDHFETYQEWLTIKGFARSSIRLHCIRLKTLFKWMKRRKYIRYNPIDDASVPADEELPPKPLFDRDFEKLYRYRFKNGQMQRAADIFIVYCRTGFHYADLQALIKDAKKGLWHTVLDYQGMEWINWDRGKTGVTAKIPIFPETKAMLTKYEGWQNLPQFANKTLNQWLKHIAAELNLREDLCVTSGRDTMTEWLYNEWCASDETVKVILGRKTTRGLSRYGSPSEKRVKKELKIV